MKRLIVNADEFGLTQQVNQGIIEAFKKGIVTSSTIIVNMWAFEEAVRLACKNPNLAVGVHLTLTSGKSVLPKEAIPTLVDEKGFFFPRSHLLRRLFFQKIRLSEVEKELKAQIEKCLQSGISPTHFDSHEHIHIHPAIFPIVIRLAKDYNVPLRLPAEEIYFVKGKFLNFFYFKYWKKKFLQVRCNWAHSHLLLHGILTTDYFTSIFGIIPNQEIKISTFKLLLKNIKDGVTELMTHPGYMDERLRIFSPHLCEQREKELKVLTDPKTKRIIKEENIELINYANLKLLKGK